MGQVAYMVLTLDGKTLYVVHQDTSTVTAIRTATRTMLPDIKAGDFPDGVAITPNGRTVYVLNGASNTLTPISAATGKAHAPIRLPGAPTAIAFRR
jgi:YVTN family beta-propeller protein